MHSRTSWQGRFGVGFFLVTTRFSFFLNCKGPLASLVADILVLYVEPQIKLINLSNVSTVGSFLNAND